MDKTLNRRRG